MRFIICLLLFFLCAFHLRAQEPLIKKYETVNADPEEIRNDDFKNKQSNFAGFTSLENGNTLLVWSTGSMSGKKDQRTYYVAQQLDSSGKLIGKTLHLDTINNYLAPYRPSVTQVGENSFAYIFYTRTQVENLFEFKQFFRIYDLTGKALTPVIPVDTGKGNQTNAQILKRENGDLIVAWYSAKKKGIRLVFRFFNTQGEPQSKIFETDSSEPDWNYSFEIASGLGKIGFAWEVNLPKKKRDILFFRLFGNDGKPLIPITRVDENDTSLSEQDPG